MINQHFNSRFFTMTIHESQLKSLLASERLFIFQNRAERCVFVLFSNASMSAQDIENV